jgi:predicted nucleotidyltransferase
MDVSRPYSILSSKLESEALFVLAGTTRPLTGRQIAELVPHGSPAGVRLALDRLVAQGLVLREEAGRAHMHTLNREHLAAPAVEMLARLRSELYERLRQTFKSWKIPPVHASLFGSTARGDGDVDSDIDLFIVRPQGLDEEDAQWRTQIDDLSERVLSWTGNHAGVIEIGEKELPGLRRKRPPVVAELERDAIDLAGPPVSRLLKRTR